MTALFNQVGKFAIEQKLGRGGMADVYLARDTESGAQVALKVLEVGADRDAQDALLAERHGAVLQARMCGIDPRVATVFEYAELGSIFYIAMEYIPGDDLSSVLRQGPLPPARCIEIALEVSSLLVTAHGLQLTVENEPHQGVIHGDIKPKNIRVTPDGRIKVLDFGIAKALSMTRKLTRNEFGSVAYSSPERLSSGDVDVHSDLWALGVVLYEMLAGRQPFQDVNTRKLEEAIRSRRPPIPLSPGLPADLVAVVDRSLSAEPARRFQSAADFKSALLTLRHGLPPAAVRLADDPEATRRTHAPAGTPGVPSRTIGNDDDPHATRRTRNVPPPIAAAAAVPAAVAAAFSPAGVSARAAMGAAPVARTRRGWVRLVLLLALAIVGVREVSVVGAARELRSTLPLKERSEMGEVWEEFQDLRERSPFGIGLAGLEGPLRDRLLYFADRILASYRTDQPTLRERDWEEAKAHLSRALTLRSERSVRARIAYCEGHLYRIDGDARGRQPQEARGFYNDAIAAFDTAVRLDPEWPDPHLGLARVYLYGVDDLERGSEALDAAKAAGYKLGNRELAQLADAYSRRGERLAREAAAVRDLPQERDVLARAVVADRRALELYERLIGFGDAAANFSRTRKHVLTIEARLDTLRAEGDDS